MAVPQLKYKVPIVGDGAVGKTTFCLTLSTNAYPGDYIPTVVDNYPYKHRIKDELEITFDLWEVLNREESDRLRPLSYPGTDCFLVCFNTIHRASFDNIFNKWIPEISHHCPGTPFVVVGMKSDLRGDPDWAERYTKQYGRALSPKECEEMSLQAGAAAYVECSSLKQKGLVEVVDTAVQKIAEAKQEDPKPKKTRQGCVLQ